MRSRAPSKYAEIAAVSPPGLRRRSSVYPPAPYARPSERVEAILVIGPPRGAQPAFGVGDEDQLADRRPCPVREEAEPAQAGLPTTPSIDTILTRSVSAALRGNPILH